MLQMREESKLAVFQIVHVSKARRRGGKFFFLWDKTESTFHSGYGKAEVSIDNWKADNSIKHIVLCLP